MKHELIRKVARLGVATAIACLAATAAGSAEATQAPAEVRINGVEFVRIPEGWFYKTGGVPVERDDAQFMPNNGGGNVKVWLDAFYVAKYEARARDLVRYLNSSEGQDFAYAGARISCSLRVDGDGKASELRAEDDLPATHLNWTLADRWARWMGFRLPTESEWEKAARGPDQRIYPWGNDHPDDTYAGFKTASDCHTWPVSSFAKGQSPYGVFNMAGNVREFVADWYDADADRALRDGVKNPAAPTRGSMRGGADSDPNFNGPWKLLKGGRWASHEHQIRIDARIYYTVDAPFRCNGTRFAVDAGRVEALLAQGKAEVIR